MGSRTLVQTVEHFGESRMPLWVSKIPFLLIFLGVAGLYHASYLPIDGNFFGAVAVTGLFGLLIVHAVQLFLRLWSAINLFNTLISTVVGFGVAAFLSLCAREIFLPGALSREVVSLIHFLLPFTIAIVSFSCLRIFPFFRASESPSSQVADTQQSAPGVRKFIPDQSVLEDGRLVDLARTGLFDGQIVVPSFLPRELKNHSESGDELARVKARKALEALRRLESLPRVGLQFKDVAVPESVELNEKIVQSAKLLNASLLTNENSPLRAETEQGMYLAIDTIANSLRPLIPKGETLSIKIQRLGKEPKQGIGYLDDGTMVVVNGGGDFLGKNVRTQVLSQKYSSSGKIIFCNVREDDNDDGQSEMNYCN